MQYIWSIVDLLRRNSHTDDPQYFPLHMELTLTAECWMKFCTYLAKVICLYSYDNLFYRPSYR